MTVYFLAAAGLIVVWLLTGGTSGRGVRAHGRDSERLKAKLEPVIQEGPTWMASGWAVWATKPGRPAALEVLCSRIRTGTGTPNVPVGAELDVVVGGRVVGSAPVRNGQVRLKVPLESPELTAAVVAAGPGIPVELRYGNDVLMRGELRPQRAKAKG